MFKKYKPETRQYIIGDMIYLHKLHIKVSKQQRLYGYTFGAQSIYNICHNLGNLHPQTLNQHRDKGNY